MLPDPDTFYRALLARDTRFDGHFFVGSRSTETYCRPICPAKKPSRRACIFFRTAAEAEREGFRACFRCRPELSPGVSHVAAMPRVVASAMARIEAGALTDGSIEDLARELRVTSRHLRRAVRAELGVSPIELSQSRRLALAKQLVDSSTLPLAEVAFASGFRSLRRFNTLFKAAYGAPPSSLRADRDAHGSAESAVIRLEYRPPYDWSGTLAFLNRWRAPGVETVLGMVYTRTCRSGEHVGWIAVYPVLNRPALIAEVSQSLLRALVPVVASLRRLFDLDADIQVIEAHLSQDARLAPLVGARPGLRLPGAFDPFEAAARAVLGSELCGRLITHYGDAFELPYAQLTHVFPSAGRVACLTESALQRLGIDSDRAQHILRLARAELRFGAAPPHEIAGDARPLIAMRACHWTDAFPAADVELNDAILRVFQERSVDTRRWSPWRAYAALHLWATAFEPPSGRRSGALSGNHNEMRFTGRVIVGHRDVAAVIVPFDPTQCWRARLRVRNTSHGRRLGIPVRGSAGGVPFDGFIGFRWARYYIILEPELLRAAKLQAGDRVEVAVIPRSLLTKTKKTGRYHVRSRSIKEV